MSCMISFTIIPATTSVGGGAGAAGGVAIGVAAGAVGVPAVVIGTAAATAATAIAGAGTIASLVAASIYQGGKSVVDCGKIVAKERKFSKTVSKMLESYTIESNDVQSQKESVTSILEYVSKNSSIFTKGDLQKALSSANNCKEQARLAYKYLESNAKYALLEENLMSLDNLAQKYGHNVCKIIEKFNNLKNNKGANTINQIESLTKEVEKQFDLLYKNHEKEIANRTFKSQYIKVDDVKENLLPAVFGNKLSELFNEKGDEEFIDLVNQRDSINVLVKIYEACYVMAESPVFKKYADNIFSLWSDAIKLTERKDISKKDFKNDVNLILNALSDIEFNMKKDGEDYENRRRFLLLLEENNKYRSLLYLDPRKEQYVPSSVDRKIRELEQENKLFKDKIIKQYNIERVAFEIKKKYISRGYTYIDEASKVVKGEGYEFRKSYYLTPDGSNILSMNINNEGLISQEVIGAKISGLPDDPAPLYRSQQKFCEHSKAIYSEIANDTDQKIKTVAQEEPSIEKAKLYYEDLSNILPQRVIAQIKENRERIRREEKKAMVVNQ